MRWGRVGLDGDTVIVWFRGHRIGRHPHVQGSSAGQDLDCRGRSSSNVASDLDGIFIPVRVFITATFGDKTVEVRYSLRCLSRCVSFFLCRCPIRKAFPYLDSVP